METPLSDSVKVFRKLNGAFTLASLEGLWPEDLPDQELRSCLALELAYLHACWFSLEGFNVKRVSRFSDNKALSLLITPVALAIQIAFQTSKNEQVLFTEQNAQYIKEALEIKLEGLGGLVSLPSDPPLESSFIFTRSVRMIDAVVKKSGLRYAKKDDDFLKKHAALYGTIMGSIAAVNNFLSAQNLAGG